MSWRVSPSARKLKALSPEFPEVKVQEKVEPLSGFAAISVPAAGVKESISRSAWLELVVRAAGTLAALKLPPEMMMSWMETSTVSLRSISTTLIEPELVMLVLASSMVVVSFPSLMTGESLVPVMVSVIGVVLDAEDSDPVAPLSSVKVTL